jgi:peptidoglycan hydrolase CwlO-like protein
MTDRERLSQLEEVVAEMLGKQDMLAEDMASLNVKMAGLNSEIALLKAKITRLETKIDRHDARFDRIDNKQNEQGLRLAENQKNVEAGQAELRSGIETILSFLKKQ